MQEVEREFDQLIAWTKTFLATAESIKPQVIKALQPSSPLPENCPSHASMAELVLRQVRKRLDEVVGAVERVEKAIWQTDSKR